MKPLATRMMRITLMMLVFSWLVPARAALDVGDSVPKLSAPAALAGKPFTCSLGGVPATGPVGEYSVPAAFSTGCSIEAHAFAAAIEQFAALDASVIGVSTDDLDTLTKFSSQACQGKFPVASDTTRSISKSFDALMQTRPDYANRISFVIAPNGSVGSCYQRLNSFRHVEKMLAAVKDLPQNRDRK